MKTNVVRIMWGILTFSMIISLFPTSFVYAEPSSTHGEDENNEAEEYGKNTVRIGTAEELLGYAAKCNMDNATAEDIVVITDDIDLSGHDFRGITIFSGILRGDNHRITGVRYKGDGNVDGFIRYTTKDAVIENLTIEGKVSSTADGIKIGGLVGANAGTIRNVTFSGSISGNTGVGGIVGINQTTGVIERCDVSGDISGYYQTGGICGYNYGTITYCKSSAEINTDYSWVEGNDETDVTDIIGNLTGEENSGAVVSSMDIGGICGYSAGVITYSTNSGNVGYPHAGYNVGGIAGRQAGYVTECTNRGVICGRKDIGGIIGQMEPYITIDDSASVTTATQSLYGQMNRTINDLSAMEKASLAETERIRNEISGTVHPTTEELRDFAAQIYNSGKEKAEQIDPSAFDISSYNQTELENAYNEAKQQEQVEELEKQADRLSGDLRGLNRSTQTVMNSLSDTLNEISSGNTAVYEDISADSIESAISGKVEHSVNKGKIEGDINSGGITGSMSIDSENPEGNAAGSTSLNLGNRYLTECVLSDCKNYGVTTAKNDGAGGILGYQILGIIYKCESYGLTRSESGSYVGGICGDSYALIRNCYADCEVYGDRYIGGVVGAGYGIENSYTLVTITADSGNAGTIAGTVHMDDNEDTYPVSEWMSERVHDNFYVIGDIFGIDGVDYAEVAEPITYDEMISKENIPTAFRRVNIVCVADDEIVATITTDYGAKLDDIVLPDIDAEEGYTGVWPDLSKETATANRIIIAEYEKNIESIASVEYDDSGDKPIGYIGGDFEKGTTFSVTDAGSTKGIFSDVQSYSCVIDGEDSGLKDEYTVRILLPDGDISEVDATIGGSVLKDLEYRIKGSYLETVLPKGTTVISITHITDREKLLRIAVTIAAAAIAVGCIFLLFRYIRRKRRP